MRVQLVEQFIRYALGDEYDEQRIYVTWREFDKTWHCEQCPEDRHCAHIVEAQRYNELLTPLGKNGVPKNEYVALLAERVAAIERTVQRHNETLYPPEQ